MGIFNLWIKTKLTYFRMEHPYPAGGVPPDYHKTCMLLLHTQPDHLEAPSSH